MLVRVTTANIIVIIMMMIKQMPAIPGLLMYILMGFLLSSDCKYSN